MSTVDIFKDVPIGELADWMRGHPGGRIAVFSRNFWHEAWDEARRILAPEASRVVSANGQERIEWANGAIAQPGERLPSHERAAQVLGDPETAEGAL